MAGRAASSARKYPSRSVQGTARVSPPSSRSVFWLTGTTLVTSPVISLVIPCVILLMARPSRSSGYSECPSMSIHPGETTRLVASMVSRACAPRSTPTAAIRSPRMATSPRYHGLPVPSTIIPLRTSRSYGASGRRGRGGRSRAPAAAAAAQSAIERSGRRRGMASYVQVKSGLPENRAAYHALAHSGRT